MSVNIFKKSDSSLKKVAGNASNNINLITNTGDIDLNSYTEEGTYKLNFDPSTGFNYTYSNGPSSILPAGGFSLTVLEYGFRWESQIFTEYGSIVQQYVRNLYYDGNTNDIVWSDWAPIFLRYSTDETFTGKCWIDGKKIYQTTFHTTIPSATEKYIILEFDATNLDRIIDMKGSIKQDTGNQTTVSYFASTVDGCFLYLDDAIKRLCSNSKSTGGGDAYIVIEYTKV